MTTSMRDTKLDEPRTNHDIELHDLLGVLLFAIANRLFNVPSRTNYAQKLLSNVNLCHFSTFLPTVKYAKIMTYLLYREVVSL